MKTFEKKKKANEIFAQRYECPTPVVSLLKALF